MSSETGTAFLIDPTGKAPEVIDAAVYQVLLQYLNLPEGSPACDAIEWLLSRASEFPNLDDKGLLAQGIWHYSNTFDHSLAEGVLASVRVTGEIEDLTRDETEILQNALTAIRAGGWFADWLQMTTSRIADATDSASKYPTPLQIASSLRGDVIQHDCNMEIAQEIVRRRPDLLFPAPAETPATPAPPAAPQVAQPATSQSTKAPRTREPRKKHAHAKASA